MRTVATYALTRNKSDSAQATMNSEVYIAKIEDWLRDKGVRQVDPQSGHHEIHYHDGRVASLTREFIETENAELTSYFLTEPTEEGSFHTHLEVATDGHDQVFFCRLSTSASNSALGPVPFAAYCPRIVRDMIELGGWTSGSRDVSTEHLEHNGYDGGRHLANLIWDLGRTLPIVVISERDGSTLDNQLPQMMSRDLAGLATVAKIDGYASWSLSQAKGKIWSCYNGAIRLYWPFRAAQNNPYNHPFWTYYWLHRGGLDSFAAADRVRNDLRTMIFEESAFRPTLPIITRIRETDRDAQRQQARDAEDYQAFAESYEEQNNSLVQQISDQDETIRRLSGEIEQLKAANRQLQLSLGFTQQTQQSADEQIQADPQTVHDAFEQAKVISQWLVFGEDVLQGISRLAPDAGPPEKILSYLLELDSMTAELRRGSLGVPMHQWLRDRNVESSPESDTTRNNPTRMARRQWDDGSGNRRQFEYHLKPNDGAPPNRCVRIYFEYDQESRKTIVGWIGRHPE